MKAVSPDAQSKSSVIGLPTWLFIAAYGGLLLLLLPRLSLWLDEILTLNVSVQPDWKSFLGAVRATQGGTPLAFLPSSWTMAVLGKTAFAGRLWSALASIAACPGLFLLGRRIGLREPLWAVILFALCPLQFRYAMEARPYSLALCLTIWSTLAFFRMLDSDAGPRPSAFRKWALIYGVSILVIAYAMVYALFVPAAHVVWLLASKAGRRAPRRNWIVCAVALILSCLSLIPWYLLFREDWNALSVRQHVSPVTFSAVPMVVHELTGAGYVGTALLAIGVALGWHRRHEIGFYLTWIVVPAALVPIADFVFYYFFAVRQMIFVLPPLILLFALGLESRRVIRCVLLTATLISFVYADVSWIRRPRENWDAAGAAALAKLSDSAACVILLPEQKGSPFLFAHPQLAQHGCATRRPAQVVVALSPYQSDAEYAGVVEELKNGGYAKQSSQDFNGPRIEVFAQP